MFNLLERRNSQICDYMPVHGWLSVVWLDGQKFDWRIGDKEIWGRGIWIDLSRKKIMKIFLLYVKCLPKGDLSRGEF